MPSRLKQISLSALTAFLALNVWTGAPLLALWLGSRVQGEGPPSMAAVAVVIVALIALCIGLYQALKATSRAYDDDRPCPERPYPCTLAAEHARRARDAPRPSVTATERIVVADGRSLAAAVFNVWFFFFSGSSIGELTYAL